MKWRVIILSLLLGSSLLGCKCEVDTLNPMDTASDSETQGPEDSTSLDTGPDTGAPEPSPAPEFYPAGRVQSPITPYVVEQLQEIRGNEPERADNVFMKVGASSTVSSNTLECFAGSNVDLGEYISLQDTLDFFLSGDAAGDTPFDRDTEAARSGHTAGWVISGDPSPVEIEIDAINPSLAFVHYGTNDMGMGSTYASAMPAFYENMMDLFDLLTDGGIIPIVTGISPRMDSTNANKWVGSYNAIIRGMAQKYQVPFMDLYLATEAIPGQGMASDGVHLNRHGDGACILTEDALQYGYNVRNLMTLEALDRLVSVLVHDQEAPDLSEDIVIGSGDAYDPFLIHRLPFSDHRNTTQSLQDEIDLYTGCESDSDESGPEYLYRLDLTETTRLRAIVLDRGAVDIDVHLLDETASAEGCLMRDHRLVEGTLSPGTYYFSLDSWVDISGTINSGEFQFTVVECAEDDTACDGSVF